MDPNAAAQMASTRKMISVLLMGKRGKWNYVNDNGQNLPKVVYIPVEPSIRKIEERINGVGMRQMFLIHMARVITS